MKDLNNFIVKLNNPQIYSGLEINVIKKEFNKKKINICLVFPDKYEIGMSHQGLKILYHKLGDIEDVNVERCFLPGRESIEIFREEKIPLFSIENKVDLKEFDLIGFSVLSELSFTNILQVLDLASIPLKSSDRDSSFPLIAAGGISAASNPEPMRDFIDIFSIGDGEEIFEDIVNIIREKKSDGKITNDPSVFKDINGLYIPSLYPIEKENGFFNPDMKGRMISRRIINKLEDPFKNKPLIVPVTDVVFNRLESEIARGCPQNCRFCQAKAYYSPYRIKNPEDIEEEIRRSLVETGFEAFSLSSLSSGDHPYIGEILENILKIEKMCLSVSIPSMRPSTLSGNILSTLSRFRKTGITIVPEAGSERLRRVINKDVNDEEIISAVRTAVKYGWQKIKFYFMIGLPTEKEEDLEELVLLVEKIIEESKRAGKNLRIHLSFSPFVPKPHTVFQWAKRASNGEIYDKIDFLKGRLKRYRNINLDFHKPEKGVVETILSRGDHRVGKLIMEAFQQGEIFSAWDSDFNYPVWETLIKKHGLEIFLEEIKTSENLPWDYLDFNFKKDYLKDEYKKAKNEIQTPSCTDMDCSDCNGCNFKYRKIKLPVEPGKREVPFQEKVKPDYNRVRLFYQKTGRFVWLSHLSMMKYIERLLRKSGIRFKCTEGFHPRIKMSSLAPLPVFAQGFDEVVELFIENSFNSEKIMNMLSINNTGLVFNRAELSNEKKKLNKDIKFVIYEIRSDKINIQKDEIKKYLSKNDKIVYRPGFIELVLDYSDRGPERFSKLYKIIDPNKEYLAGLIRREIVYKDQEH
ncbi:MAG: TIGR03960 family B12-binding radical SAM protein [Acidobacteriota bacterium]